MADEIFYVTVETRPPREDNDCGEIEEGFYKVEGNTVSLVTRTGTQRRDRKAKAIKGAIGPGETARAVAWRLTKQHMPNRNSGFNRKLNYPTINY